VKKGNFSSAFHVLYGFFWPFISETSQARMHDLSNEYGGFYMKRDLKKIIAEMTLVEKASLCSGLNHSNTKPIERLGIPSIKTSDEPHGLNTRAPGHDAQDGFAESLPSTCYPSGSALAASWDTDLIMNVAAAIGKEAQAKDVGHY